MVRIFDTHLKITIYMHFKIGFIEELGKKVVRKPHFNYRDLNFDIKLIYLRVVRFIFIN